MKKQKYKLKVINLDVTYGSLHVLNNISLEAKKGEILSIIGPSGCGKTTLLLHAGGFLKSQNQEILFDGERVNADIHSKTGLVFQNQSLFPWKTLEQNVLLGLKKSTNTPGQAKMLIEKVDLKGYEEFYPNQLSVGMCQRGALAQVFVSNPDLILMDEPFGSLDYLTRKEMQHLLLKIWEENKNTIILVTHDIDEAIFLSDRIIVMTKKPSRIKKVVTNPFPRLKDNSLITGSKYLELKKEILGLINSA